MHQATKELIERFDEIGILEVHFWTDVIMRYGSVEDAEVLADKVIANPDHIGNWHLLQPVMLHGNQAIAQRLFERCLKGAPYESHYHGSIAHCVGFLGFQELLPHIWHVIQSAKTEGVRKECLALLHLNCQEIAVEIRTEIDRHFGKWLFPEFLPVLAHFTGDRKYIETLFNWGEGLPPTIQPACSTCNGGLILGIALFGEHGLPYFKRLLWSEKWDLAYGGTGSIYYAYLGMRVLGLSFKDIHEDLKVFCSTANDSNAVKYAHHVMINLLESHIEDHARPMLKFLPPLKESWLDLLRWLSTDAPESFWLCVISIEQPGDLSTKLRYVIKLVELEAQHEMERRLSA